MKVKLFRKSLMALMLVSMVAFCVGCGSSATTTSNAYPVASVKCGTVNCIQ